MDDDDDDDDDNVCTMTEDDGGERPLTPCRCLPQFMEVCLI